MLRRSPLRRTPFKAKRSTKSIIPQSVRDEVMARANGMCEIDHPNCDIHAVHLHHILMRSHGGQHTSENLIAVCSRGHDHIHHNPALAYEQGWLQRSGVAQ
jgi:5-methylcytosine-specific restriction endonuclease McrA